MMVLGLLAATVTDVEETSVRNTETGVLPVVGNGVGIVLAPRPALNGPRPGDQTGCSVAKSF